MLGIMKRCVCTLALGISLNFLDQVDAAVVNAKSVSYPDVAAAVESAKSGDTVVVPAGTASWTTTLTITKAITLEGAGIGRTIITDDLSHNGSLLVISTEKDKFYRLTGFEFRPGARTQVFSKGCVAVIGDSKTFRIDHCKFDRIRNRFIYTRNAVCGVIDHCDFVCGRGGVMALWHDTLGGGRWGDGSWATPINWGSADAIYIEDNKFSVNPPRRVAVLDECAGARFVFRYNTLENGAVASHGTGSTGRNRSVRQWEIYKNTFTADPRNPAEAIHMRGGTGVVFDNAISGFSKFLTLHTYRYSQAFKLWCGSDGTCNWDLNDPKVYATGTAGEGSGVGRNETGGTLIVPGANWKPNQWVGYTVRNLDGKSNNQSPTNDGRRPERVGQSQAQGPGPFFASIISNTADTIIVKGGSKQIKKVFAPGDRFEIRKVIQGLDMIGASTGDLLSDEKARYQRSGLKSQNQPNKRGEVGSRRGPRTNPVRPRATRQAHGQGKNAANSSTPRWLNQKIEPVYIWNNTLNGAASAGVGIATVPQIEEGVHFFNNKPKPDYRPLVHPHPLVAKDATSTSASVANERK